MANLTAVIGADTSKFVEEIKSARYMLDKFVSDTKKSSTAAKQNTTVTNEQVAAYQRVLKSLEKAGNGSLSTAKQTKVLESQVRELRIQWANLSEEARKGDFGKSLSATIQTANAQLRTLNQQLVQTQTNLQGKKVNPFTNLQKGAANLTSTMSALGMAGGSTISTIGTMGATLANPYVLAGAAAAGATAAVVSYGAELEKQTSQTQKFLGVTREEASATRASIKSICDAYGTDYNTALGMVDTLTKQFGVDTKTATDLISIGMAGGANEAGHMADMIGQFSGIFSDAGLSAQQMIGVMAQTQSGIFSEQGMSIISKAGQRITQMSSTVKQALSDIGINGDEMAKKLADGSMTTWDAIKTVSSALKKLPGDCQAFAVAAKEVFGKSGPEAGSKMITMLSDMDISIESVIANMTEEEKATYNLQKASEELHSSLQSLFGTSSNGFATMTTEIKTKVIKVVTDLVNKFIDLYNQSTLFRGAISSLVAVFKSVWSVLKGFIKGAMVGFEGLIVMVEDLLNLDFNKFGRDFTKFGNDFKKLDKQLSTEITKAWANAVDKTLNGKINKIKVETTNTTKNKVQTPSTTTNTSRNGKLSTDKKAVTDAKKNLDELKKLEKEFKAIELKPSLSSYDIANNVNPYDTTTKEGVQKLMDFNDKLIDKLDNLRVKFEEIGGTGSSAYNQICSAILNATNENIRLGDSSKNMMDKATKEAKQKLEEEFNNIEFTPTFSSFEVAIGSAKFDTKTIEGIQLQMDFNDNLIKQLKQLQEGYEKAGLQGEESYEKVADKIKTVQDEQSKLSKDAKKKSKKTTKEKFDSGVQQYQTITEPLMGIDNVVGQFESLQKAIEDGASAWEVFIGVVQTVDSVLQTVSATIEAVNTIQQLLGTTTQTTAAIQSTAVAQDSANTAIEIGNSQAKMAAKQGEAIGNVTASGGKMPFPYNLAAIAAGIAAVVAAFAMVGSFADGGIINGKTSIGDYNIARVNGGEMILNNTQQGNLWNAIKNNKLGDGGVAIVGGDVRIKGSDLYVALKNYSKVQGKLGKTTGIV